MFFAFFFMCVLFCGFVFVIGVAVKKLAAHAKENPQAAQAWVEHLVKPVLTPGKKEDPPKEKPDWEGNG